MSQLNTYVRLCFHHCWSVDLEQSSGHCSKSKLHHSSFQALSKDIYCSHGTSAPSTLGEMGSLVICYINGLVDIYVEPLIVVGMGHMCLNVLNFSDNCITHLPAELHQMCSLRSLEVDGNPIVQPPTNVTRLQARC